MKCPMCHCEVFGRPTQCEDCGYRFVRSDFEKVKENPIENDEEGSGKIFCVINGILGLVNMLLLFFPIVSGYGMSYNIFGLLSGYSSYGGYVSAGVNVVFFYLTIMFILELIFIIMSFCGARASGGVGIPASLVTFMLLNNIKGSFSSNAVTFSAHLLVIIPIITFILSIIVLAVCRKR